MSTATEEIEMTLELEAVKNRYANFFDAGEAEVAPAVTAKVIKGQTTEAWVTIYSTRDHTASTVTVDAAKRKILQKWPDGTSQFTLKPDPRYVYKRDPESQRPVLVNEATHLCRLHKDSPDREWLDSIGLAGQECTVNTIPNMFQRDMHMKVKHKQEYSTIQQEEQRKLDAESRDLQRQQVEAMTRMTGGTMAPVVAETTIYHCGGDCSRFFDSDQGLKIHRSKEGH